MEKEKDNKEGSDVHSSSDNNVQDSEHHAHHTEHEHSTHHKEREHHVHHKAHHAHKEHEHHKHHDTNTFSKPLLALVVIAALFVVFNQVQINSVSNILNNGLDVKHKTGKTSLFGGSLSDVNVDELQSTAQTLAAVFPELEGASGEEVMGILFPTGTPEYGADLEVSFDDPVGSLETLARMYNGLKNEVQQSKPEAFQRFVNLASNPKGVSCEYCCGVGAAGVDKNGNSLCGCQHNPAVASLALYLSAYSDYTDPEILREVMRWKTLFFPKNMIELGSSIAGGDSSVLENLPGMVGGC